MTLRAGALATLAVALLSAGCESTEQRSARIARRLADQRASTATTALGARSATVTLTGSAIVSAGGATAVALRLTSSDALTERDVPVLIDVRDAKGALVYSNDTTAIEAALREIALMPARASVWWVDDQVLATSRPSSVSVRVGVSSSRASDSSTTPISAQRVTGGSDFAGSFVSGTLVNPAASAAKQVTVYAVAMRGSRVTAAGRGLLATLPAHGSAPFRVAMIGAVTGARITVTVAPGT
jgi:hypothetical protein